MKTTFNYIKCSLVGLLVTSVMLSCGENSQKTKDNANESFRNSLSENLTDVATTNKKEEEQRKIREILQGFVGTYTINCKTDNFTTYHVPKNYFTEARTSREWIGTIEWTTILIIRDDLSACIQKANIRHYNENHRLVESGEGQIMEVGHLEPITENLFFISTEREHTFIQDAIGSRYDSYGGKDGIGVDFKTNNAVFDITTNTLYQSYDDYKKRNDRFGYDWTGYSCAKFSFHK